MSERGGQQDIARRVEELERYFGGDELSLEGVQERIAGIPPGAVRDSDFFRRACQNEGVTLAMIECLLDAFPDAARSASGHGWSPLHCTCMNKNMDPRIVRLLLDLWPESVNHQSNGGILPLHTLCALGVDDVTASVAILDLLLAAAPDSVTLVAQGALPIHCASHAGKSFPFCKRLVDAYPQSLRVRGGRFDGLPIHDACYYGNVKTVKYMLEQYPESIVATNGDSDLPILCAVRTESHEDQADIVRYLLAKDPDCASKTDANQRLSLHVACGNPSSSSLEPVRLLFDAYPEAITIRHGRAGTPLDLAREKGNDAFAEFLEAQLVYARKAEDMRAMTTPDENGWLPLHLALRDGASLGAIKLLITGNQSALRVAVNGLAFPLHIACEFSAVGVVECLLGLLDIHLHTLDLQKDSTLHYACRGGNVEVVTYLLERGVPSVSAPNNAGKLPVHLLWESKRVDRDSLEYVDAVLRLLLAHPETVTR